jgi:hypothetical protein
MLPSDKALDPGGLDCQKGQGGLVEKRKLDLRPPRQHIASEGMFPPHMPTGGPSQREMLETSKIFRR